MNLLSTLPPAPSIALHSSDTSSSTRTCLYPCAAWSDSNPTRGFMKMKVNAVSDVSVTTLDPVQAQVTWQIVVGAVAGVTPFIVAGIEFSKRIAAQKRCEICAGSGLVLREKKYFRCPNCGGFLPWQSWKRFFSG